MKKLLIFCFLWQSLPVFSQLETTTTAVTNFQTYGYVDGVRLDSLNAEYATIEWGFSKLFFNYGQSTTRKKKTVTNEKGQPMMFAEQSLSFSLNFLYFNGWELEQAYYDPSDKTDMLILKRRHVVVH
jgi:hypothetical protein